MKKLVLIFLISCTGSVLFAQLPSFFLRNTEKAVTTHALPNVSKALEVRAQQTFQKAKDIHLQDPLANRFLLNTVPSKKMTGFNSFSLPQIIYPGTSYLKTKKQFGNYFVSRNNRLFVNQYPRALEAQKLLMDNISNFENEYAATSFPSDLQSIPQWLIKNIPQSTQYLLLGEMHGYPEIQTTISELLSTIRKQYPQKEIILFSEFLYSPQVWQESHATTRGTNSPYVKLWNIAEELNMLVVGLEPEFVNTTKGLIIGKGIDVKGNAASVERNIWASLEGVRLRNEEWKVLLTKYQQEHPDALFVLHTGAAHTQYNMPFSLGKDFFPIEKTFMVNIFPEYLLDTDSWLVGVFDEETEGKFSRAPILLWKNKELAKIAGFDAQLKVKIFPHE